MSGILNSSLNGSASNIPESTGRSFATSFSGQSGAPSPVFHHSGTIQGFNNIHGSFNVPNMQGTLASRNSSLSSIASGGVQQPTGGLSSRRFASNNLPVAISQLSHSGSHGHSGFTNRGGLGVSPILGNTGPRITTSMGNMVGGGNIGRNISSGGGLSMPGLASRLTLSGNSGSGNLSMQGQNRLMSGLLQQGSPQVVSMLQNSYPSAGGPLSQSHVQAVNNLSSMGMLNDVNSSDNAPFDINDFPQLTSRPSSAGGPQGQLGSVRKQGLGISPIVQQNQEFSIQNEDFPALPGFKGGNADYAMDMHQKEQLSDSSLSMMQSQHFPMGRSAGFNLGGTFSSHRGQQQQQQQHGSSVSTGGIPYTSANNQDILRLHGSDMFQSSHSAYHSQTSEALGVGLRPLNSPNMTSGIGSHDHLLQQFQHNQVQLRMLQILGVNPSYADHGANSLQETDRFGILGLLSVIRVNDPDLASIALGIDLTSLGLNLNSQESLYKTFGSPWSDEPSKGDPEFTVPLCYYSKPPPPLHQGYFSKFTVDTLFYIFYSMPKDEAQLYAANELYNRGWIYHKQFRFWLTRVPNIEPLVKTNTYERGSYHCFDDATFQIIRKDNFVLHYEMLEKRPTLPQH